MRRRILAVLTGAAVLVGLTALPAAAQAGGDVLVSEPSTEELCAVSEDVGEGVDPAALEQLLADAAGDLGDVEPEPVKGAAYDDLAAALGALLDDSEDATLVSVVSDGAVLAVSMIPDLSECEELGDLAGGAGLQAGNYLIELPAEDVCAAAEELEGEAGQDVAGDLAEAGAGLEALLPRPADDPARFDEVRDALDAVRAEVGDAGEVTAVHDGSALVVTTVPSPEDCDVPVEVAAGVGGSQGGTPVWAFALLAAGLLSIAGAVALRPAVDRARR